MIDEMIYTCPSDPTHDRFEVEEALTRSRVYDRAGNVWEETEDSDYESDPVCAICGAQVIDGDAPDG